MPTPAPQGFSHLSIRDLIEAREMFHAHLINKKNVVATAIGRYLIRRDDLRDGRYEPSAQRPKPARTLSNSIVVEFSWPCILVFVSEWQHDADLLSDVATDIVPKCVYMPDGRMVPICVVQAPRDPISPDDEIDIDTLRFPDNLIGGGYPLIIHSQGADRVATVACVVTDGHEFYALTNRHVAGEGGEIVYSRFGHNRQRIGVASDLHLGATAFEKLYPGWALKSTLVNCDVGLIAIDDQSRWKTDIFTLGAFDEVFDLNTFNLDLTLIAQRSWKNGEWVTSNGHVLGYGAVSGRLDGEIAALFYRYKSVGGAEYVSDFLIAGREGTDLSTHHGDSGTLWLYEAPGDDGNDRKLHPIALHWGQHELFTSGESGHARFAYGLATCLSNMCRELDVDIVRGWNVDLPYTWGKVGHYTVAARAIQAVTEPSLRKLLNANIPNITFANDKINAGLDTKGNPDLPKDPDSGMCPLADVPDIIWKQSKATTSYGRMGDENPNHFADADAPSTGGKTLFELCDKQDQLTVEVWNKYYDDIDLQTIGVPSQAQLKRGLICFRVWQIYDYMVDALQARRVDKFIFGAGVLAHYVGDGCQPLHSSYMADGDPADNQTIQYTAKRTSPHHQAGDVYSKPVNPGQGVHVAYEDTMIDAEIDTIFPAIPGNAAGAEPIAPIDSGQAAGFATLTLMKKTQDTIHPKEIVEAFKAARGSTNVTQALSDQFRDRTVEVLARGSSYLAAIWTAAWNDGGGDGNINDLGLVDDTELRTLYRDRNELPSMHLDAIGPLLRMPGAPVGGGNGNGRPPAAGGSIATRTRGRASVGGRPAKVGPAGKTGSRKRALARAGARRGG